MTFLGSSAVVFHARTATEEGEHDLQEVASRYRVRINIGLPRKNLTGHLQNALGMYRGCVKNVLLPRRALIVRHVGSQREG